MRSAAETLGLATEIRHFGATTRTAVDAAREIGCELGQIVKSLVFLADGAPILALVAGTDRVDEAKLASLLGASRVRRATADEARAATGYPIGGVPPFGLDRPLRVLLDRGLLRHDEIWAGAGTGEAVIRLRSEELRGTSGVELVDIS